eukprot:1156662-Pelagomonas_calceolata.AAC.2
MWTHADAGALKFAHPHVLLVDDSGCCSFCEAIPVTPSWGYTCQGETHMPLLLYGWMNCREIFADPLICILKS